VTFYQKNITTAKDGKVLVVGFFIIDAVEDLKDDVVCRSKYAYPLGRCVQRKREAGERGMEASVESRESEANKRE
jgi:hypothetical protein